MGSDDTDHGKNIGNEPDEKLANGPIEKRGCTDILCCLIFVAFFWGWIGCTIWGFSNGNPGLIGRGYDIDGNICGYTSGFGSYELLYFVAPPSTSKTVCVSSCPDGTNTMYWAPNTVYTASATVQLYGACTMGAGTICNYNSVSYFDRACLPTATLTAFSAVTSAVESMDTLSNWISDIRTTWKIIVASMALAIFLGFVYMFFVRFCAGVMIWGAIFGIWITSVILGAFYYTGAKSISDLSSTYATGSNSSGTNSSKTTNYVLAYTAWAFAGIMFLFVCCTYSRIKLAIAIIKAAADYVKSTPQIMLVPPVMLLVLIGFYVYCAISAIYLFSSGDSTKLAGTQFGSFTYDNNTKYVILYTIFGILWGNAFIGAASQLIIAGSCCIWYFSQPQGAHSTVSRSVYRFFRYHIGTVAFGSLLVAIIQAIRLILAYIQAKVAKSDKDKKRMCLLTWILKCAQCYVACFERFIKFINKNAYIQTALSGKNFCLAAKDAFFLIVKNPIRFGMVHSIGGIFILFGKLAIASACTLFGYAIIKYQEPYKSSVYSPLVPTICIFIASYGIATLFLSVYSMASDCILACFVLDSELQKKKNAGPLHCPSMLKEFIDKNKKD